MNYQLVYDSLIGRAKNRLIENNVYYESHHIIPKCIGGSNYQSNIVKLTYREHFVSHWLLHKIYPDNSSLRLAFMLMAFGSGFSKGNRLIPSSRLLEEKKLKLIKYFSTNEFKQKLKDGWSKRSRKLGNRMLSELKDFKQKVDTVNDYISEYLKYISDDNNVSYMY
jgi:hypothetical protein